MGPKLIYPENDQYSSFGTVSANGHEVIVKNCYWYQAACFAASSKMYDCVTIESCPAFPSQAGLGKFLRSRTFNALKNGRAGR